MTSIWAFLIGMLTAFGFMFIFWIILKGFSKDTFEDKALKPQNDKPATICSCINRYCCKKKLPNKPCVLTNSLPEVDWSSGTVGIVLLGRRLPKADLAKPCKF
ncbi:hypothetical protein QTP88_000245 [Uroleucon formosanum]